MIRLDIFVSGAALLVFSLLPSTGQAQSSPQGQNSVAEAARKARAKKKPPLHPAKVVTNDDLQSGASTHPSGAAQAPLANAATTQGQTQDQAASSGTTPNAPPAQSEESRWRKRFASTYRTLRDAEAELSVLEREWSKLQTQYYPDPTKAMREQHDRADLNDHQKKIDAKKKQIEQLHQAISDLEDALRKAGGSPGWARE